MTLRISPGSSEEYIDFEASALSCSSESSLAARHCRSGGHIVL